VVKYIDSWEEDNRLFILTELYPLGNFSHFLSEYGSRFERLEEVRCWKIIADLSSVRIGTSQCDPCLTHFQGLEFIHGASIVHLDIKPENIFIGIDGCFVIGDFGLASEWPRDHDAGFEREGDKQYLAAEVLQGVYGKAADIFRLVHVVKRGSLQLMICLVWE
jgi:mitosis inhibitor protein kinase SWE1